MSRPVRLTLFAVAACGLAAVLFVGFHRLPHFGHAHELYGALANRTEPTLRHATDVVTALNFDLRAFDTLGEEFILFASVSGVALLLRQLRDEDEEEQRQRHAALKPRLARLLGERVRKRPQVPREERDEEHRAREVRDVEHVPVARREAKRR